MNRKWCRSLPHPSVAAPASAPSWTGPKKAACSPFSHAPGRPRQLMCAARPAPRANPLPICRDRIVVGKMREGSVALETLKARNTGHPGGLSIIHANSAPDALSRLEDLLAETGPAPHGRLIGQSLELIVHTHRTAERRRLGSIPSATTSRIESTIDVRDSLERQDLQGRSRTPREGCRCFSGQRLARAEDIRMLIASIDQYWGSSCHGPPPDSSRWME